MQAIVVTLDVGGVRDETKVFIVKNDTYTVEVTQKAEAVFTEFIKDIDPEIEEDDLNACLDNGIYDEDGGNYRAVTLTWVCGVETL